MLLYFISPSNVESELIANTNANTILSLRSADDNFLLLSIFVEALALDLLSLI